MSARGVRLDDDQYRELLAFRTALRRFLHWSEQQAELAGLTGQQHQLLLAIRGTPARSRRRSARWPSTCWYATTRPSSWSTAARGGRARAPPRR